METNRFKQRLGSETSKVSLNSDFSFKLNMEGKTKLLPLNEINHIVNLGEQFDIERQNSTFYRIIGNINPTMTNALFNLDNQNYLDLYTWKGFNYSDPLTLDFRFYDSVYPKNIQNYLKERDGWFGYFNPDIKKSGFCDFNEMEPKSSRFYFTPDTKPFFINQNNVNFNSVKNWNITITYPHHIDSGHTMVNNGLLIIDALPVIVSNRNMTAIGLASKHNLLIGDTVRIIGTNGYDGDHVVIGNGLDNGDLKENYFVIDRQPNGSVNMNSRIKRLFGGVESIYYFRVFRKIKTRFSDVIKESDYEIYNLAFSQGIYNDNIFQFTFNEDIDVSDLRDNLGRPLSEIYLTILKTDSNGLFTNVSSGIETNFIPVLNTSDINIYLLSIPIINKIHNGITLPFPSHIPLENNVTINNNNNILGNNDFYGDLVEFNLNEFKETVLSEVHHRFNTNNRETAPTMTFILNPANLAISGSVATSQSISLGPRQEGYYYKPHHLIKIREFSTYIEQSDINTIDLPDYAINLGDGRYIWRDLLDIGVNQTNNKALDYPFLNGCHYMFDNYCFNIKRQDPFNNWGLFYSNYPADPIGKSISNKFDFNISEDVC